MKETRTTIEGFFEGLGKKQATRSEMERAGISLRRIARAVESGSLRAGTTGYWLPRPADPGAASVMRRAMTNADHAEENL